MTARPALCWLAAACLLLPLASWGQAAPAASAASAARTQTPDLGQYGTERGWGVLRLRATAGGPRFRLESIGSNGHTCSLEGPVEGMGARAELDGVDDACVIRFERIADGLRVSVPETHEACQAFCGARAAFEGEYLRLPPGCSPLQRQQTRDQFTRLYRQGEHEKAHPILLGLMQQCKRYTEWMELDEWRNDLAINAAHLGHKDECLRWSAETLAHGKSPDELKAALPPADYEAYLPVAKAAWHNIARCSF